MNCEYNAVTRKKKKNFYVFTVESFFVVVPCAPIYCHCVLFRLKQTFRNIQFLCAQFVRHDLGQIFSRPALPLNH